jgi:hypothetical protein
MFEAVCKCSIARPQEGLTWAGSKSPMFQFGTAVCSKLETLGKMMNG